MAPPPDSVSPPSGPPVGPLSLVPLVIIGAGAAGLLTAIFAARAGVPTRLLETRPRPGAKIRVSGGGRCNVLPSVMAVDDFHTEGSRNALRNVRPTHLLDPDILAAWKVRPDDIRPDPAPPERKEHAVAVPVKKGGSLPVVS